MDGTDCLLPENLLKKNWSQANQLYNKAFTNSSGSEAAFFKSCFDFHKDIGKGLIGNICLGFSKETKEEEISELLKYLKQEYGPKGLLPFDYLLGFAIFQELVKTSFFCDLSKSIKEFNLNNISLSDDSSSERDGEWEEGSTTFYTSMKGKANLSQDTFAEIKRDNQDLDEISLLLNEDEINYNSDHFTNENPEVLEYLLKLSKATTELSNLCQHMKWSQPHSIQTKSALNSTLYAANIEVLIRAKNSKGAIITGECSAAASKKEARRVASLFLLQKIYNNIPGIWQKYKNLREENSGLQQVLDANNQKIFKKAKMDILDSSLLQEQKKPEEKSELGIKIDLYLDKLPSYKNQMNILVGKYKKITPIQFKDHKVDELGLWPIQASAIDGGTEIRGQAKDSSKKKAAEKACREILFQIYHRNEERWMDFIKHKKAKNME